MTTIHDISGMPSGRLLGHRSRLSAGSGELSTPGKGHNGAVGCRLGCSSGTDPGSQRGSGELSTPGDGRNGAVGCRLVGFSGTDPGSQLAPGSSAPLEKGAMVPWAAVWAASQARFLALSGVPGSSAPLEMGAMVPWYAVWAAPQAQIPALGVVPGSSAPLEMGAMVPWLILRIIVIPKNEDFV